MRALKRMLASITVSLWLAQSAHAGFTRPECSIERNGFPFTNMQDTYRTIENATANTVDRVAALLERALMFGAEGLYECARSDATEAVRLDPLSAGTHARLGQTLHMLHQDRAALPELELALHIAESGGGAQERRNSMGLELAVYDAHLQRAQVLESLGEFRRALVDLSWWVLRAERDAQGTSSCGLTDDQMASLKGSGTKELEELNEMMRRTCESRDRIATPPIVLVMPLLRRAAVYLKAGEVKLATVDCDRLMPLTESNPMQDVEACGDVFVATKSYDRAVLAYDQSVRAVHALDTQWSNWQIQISDRFRKNHVAYQKEKLSRILASDCRAKVLGGWLDAAMDDCRDAIKTMPENAAAHLAFGLAYEAAGKKQQAIEELRVALQYDPRLEEAKVALRRLGAGF